MREHTVTAFDAELDVLRATVVEMGRLAEEALGRATAALGAADRTLAAAVVEADAKIDALALAVEEEAVAITARRQPVAVDLREVFTAFRIAIDLERIGDLAKSIGRRVLTLDPAVLAAARSEAMDRLAARVRQAVRDAVEAFRRGDGRAAEAVRGHDDEIDRLYTEAFRGLLVEAKDHDLDVECALQLMFCAKNLERAGDHATNVAEATVFRLSGIFPDPDRPRAVDTP